jgi:type II secretory pathway component HofQ
MTARSIVLAAAVALLVPVTAAAQAVPRTPAEQRDAQLATPKLNPSATVTMDVSGMPVKDIVDGIAKTGGLTVSYHSGATNLSAGAAVKLSNATLEDALQMVLESRGLAFKVTGPKSVFIYPNTPENRQKYTDSVRAFAIANADISVLGQVLNRALTGTFGADDLRPVIYSDKESRTVTVRATADTMAKVAKLIADNDKK